MVLYLKSLVELISVSFLFVISILSVVLVGLLISESYKNRNSKKIKFLLILLGGFIVHMVFDAFSIFDPTSLFLKIDIVADIIVILVSIIMFYLLWEILDMFWKHIFVFLMVVGIVIDILAEIYLEILILELIHFVLMLGIFVSVYFIIIKFLIKNVKDKK